MINLKQLRSLIRRTLVAYALSEKDSHIELLIGTAAQESRAGTYLKQLGNAPAVGIFQMEPGTFEWLKKKYQKRFGLQDIRFEELEWNLKYSILFARLRYLVVPERIPDELEGWAYYWKKYYNTTFGKGTEEEFIRNYELYAGRKNDISRELYPGLDEVLLRQDLNRT